MSLNQKQLLQLLMCERVKLSAYIWLIVRDNHLAEDVFQEVAMSAVDHLDEFETSQHCRNWLRQAAKFRAIDAVRRRTSVPVTFDSQTLELLDSEWSAYDQSESSELLEALEVCIGKLTPRARQMLDLRYSQGARSGEIARSLNQKVTAVYKALTRLHQTLAECIRKQISEKIAV